MSNGRHRGSRARQRRTHWVSGQGATTVSASGSTLLFTQPGPHDGETIVRIRGICTGVATIIASIGDGFSGAFGMGIVSAAAATAGVASIPTPVTEAAWDGWMWHQFFFMTNGKVGAANGSSWFDKEINSKAMRKLTSDDALVAVVEVTETGDATAELGLLTRILAMTG